MTPPLVPPALTRGPFTIDDAAAWGLTRAELRSGVSAAWIWGMDPRRTVDDPLEVTVPRGRAQRAWPGLVVRRALLPEEDIVRFGRVAVTSALRTAFDLARRPPGRRASWPSTPCATGRCLGSRSSARTSRSTAAGPGPAG